MDRTILIDLLVVWIVVVSLLSHEVYCCRLQHYNITINPIDRILQTIQQIFFFGGAKSETYRHHTQQFYSKIRSSGERGVLHRDIKPLPGRSACCSRRTGRWCTGCTTWSSSPCSRPLRACALCMHSFMHLFIRPRQQFRVLTRHAVL